MDFLFSSFKTKKRNYINFSLFEKRKRNFKCCSPVLRRERDIETSYFSRGEREIFTNILFLKNGGLIIIFGTIGDLEHAFCSPNIFCTRSQRVAALVSQIQIIVRWAGLSTKLIQGGFFLLVPPQKALRMTNSLPKKWEWSNVTAWCEF